jgi:hypothetical protein
MTQAYRDIAQRGVNAQRQFAALLVNLGGITESESKAVTAFYLKERIAKTDYVMGVVNVKHGAFLDRTVIRRAAAEVARP